MTLPSKPPSVPNAASQARVKPPGTLLPPFNKSPISTSIQRKQPAPPVYRPTNAAPANPAVYRPNVAPSLQRKPVITAPPAYRPQAPTPQSAVQQRSSPAAAAIRVDGAIQRLMIGDASNHHLHVGGGVHQPHYKQGNSQGSRINFGHNQTYTLAGLEATIDVLRDRLDEEGAQDCYDWCLAEARSQNRAERRRVRQLVRRMRRSGRQVPHNLAALTI
jgi:hypothetical protein